MDFSLDQDEGLLVATLRRWSDRQLRGWAADADRAGLAPAALWGAAAELGLLIDAVPSDAGGLADGETSHLARALRGIELGRGCAGMAALCETNVEPALAAVRWGSEVARRDLFGTLVAAGAPALAVTVHDFHRRLAITSDAGGALEVTGRIGPAPGLALASHILCAAHAGTSSQPVLFLLRVPAGRVKPIVPSGWRAGAWGTLELERAPVPPDFVLVAGTDAPAAIAQVLSWWRVNLAARAIGVATAAIDHAAAYGAERVQFGQAIGTFQSLARMRDENQTAIAAARLLVLEAAWQIDRAHEGAADAASRARDLAAQVVTRATIDAVQMYGGYGFVNDFPVEKLMRDARAFEVLGGNEALARLLQER